MGLYFNWLFGCAYDSDSCCVQGLRSVAEKEEQTPPIGQKIEPGPRNLSCVSRRKKRRGKERKAAKDVANKKPNANHFKITGAVNCQVYCYHSRASSSSRDCYITSRLDDYKLLNYR